jgi:drug/metabolite transporter (DMT)-like permease
LSADWPSGESFKLITPRTIGFIALAGAILGYGGLWPVSKTALEFTPPFWYASIRIAIGATILFGVLLATGKLRLPTRHDMPLVLNVGIFMMAIYTLMMHIALLYVDAGRAALLGYTTPIWVLPAAYFILKERPSRRRLLGLAVAVSGLMVLFNPASFDWSNTDVVIGNLLLLGCGLSWSISIVHIRKHKPVRTPLQLAPFQLSLAAALIAIMALIFDPLPVWTGDAIQIGVFTYGGIMGTAVAMLSVTTAVRYLPTVVSTVGLLGVPVFALTLSVVFLGEQLTVDLVTGVVLILAGIGLVSVPDRKPAAP